MGAKVELSEIIQALESPSDTEFYSYLHKETGKVLVVTDVEMAKAEDNEPLENVSEWQREAIETARDIFENEEDYLGLPDASVFHEYRVMEKFCLSIENEAISDDLYYTIKGSGAFRRFKDAIHKLGIADEWHQYRDRALKKFAIEWCEANNLEYIEG